jgi:mannose-6-phosphate isomerase-like protein (cupin superfamily)
MRFRWRVAIALIFCLLPLAALAQSQPASTVRTLLAAGRVGSVVETPLAFRLLSVSLPSTQRASYSGPNAMLYALSGGLGLELGGNSQPLAESGGAFIPGGLAATFSASGSEPAKFLLFVLLPIADVQKPLVGPPATVEELYRSPEALPGLQPGPYEFSLTRVSFPPGMPANPPHYRSGDVLYFVAAGSGTFIADGRSEPRSAGMPHFERAGWVHQWANPGTTRLVLIQANISQEGVPAVLPAGGK